MPYWFNLQRCSWHFHVFTMMLAYRTQVFCFSLQRSKRWILLSISAVHQTFYISICISTLPTQYTTFIERRKLVSVWFKHNPSTATLQKHLRRRKEKNMQKMFIQNCLSSLITPLVPEGSLHDERNRLELARVNKY